jgi:hypothetical protein
MLTAMTKRLPTGDSGASCAVSCAASRAQCDAIEADGEMIRAVRRCGGGKKCAEAAAVDAVFNKQNVAR